MTKQLNEQVVVITGASSGIGRATALEFAAKGARVAVAARNADALDSLVDEIRAAGGQAIAVPTDVTDEAQVHELATRTEAAFGRIDTWVNNAGVGLYATVEDTTAEEFDRVMRVNFLGQVHGVQAALGPLRRAGGGTIIGLASVEGERTMPLHGAYSASKRAVRGLYDALRMELAEAGEPIAVTTILPAAIDTPFFEHSRSKIGALPKPPPPVYAPELVAGAIVRAATKPTREVPVGGAAVGFFQGQRVSPALTDAVLSLTRVGIGAQTSDQPDNGIDNLYGPVPGDDRIRGRGDGDTHDRSLFTTLVAGRRRAGDMLTGAVGVLHRNDREDQTTTPADH